MKYLTQHCARQTSKPEIRRILTFFLGLVSGEVQRGAWVNLDETQVRKIRHRCKMRAIVKVNPSEVSHEEDGTTQASSHCKFSLTFISRFVG
jgi:hypothetical protein